MINSMASAAFQPQRIETLPSRANAHSAAAMTEEYLPFTVKLVRDADDLSKAVSIRHSAYARHLPEFAQTLKEPESADVDKGVVVLLAQSKLDGSPLGTMRIQTNQFKPLCLEQSIELPAWLKPLRLAEATRLGVTDGKVGRLVTTVLFKAYFQYCQQIGVEWMVVTGRAPVDRMYDRLLFDDVFPDLGYMPIAHVGNLPHRVMQFHVDTAEERWIAANHPLLGFMCHTHHPDINIGGTRRRYVAPMALPVFPAQGAAFPM